MPGGLGGASPAQASPVSQPKGVEVVTPEDVLDAVEDTALDRMVAQLVDQPDETMPPLEVSLAISRAVAAELHLALAALRWMEAREMAKR